MGYNTFIKSDPIVESPRNPIVEAMLNIKHIIDGDVSTPNHDTHFDSLFAREVHAGAFTTTITRFPAVSIECRSWDGHDLRGLGTSKPHVFYNADFLVSYYHCPADKQHDDLEISRNLWRLFDLLEYRNDLNGFCPRSRAKPGSVRQVRTMSIATSIADVYSGGEIDLMVPLSLHRTFFDAGQHERDLVMPSGARH